jgi:hypothetical protein
MTATQWIDLLRAVVWPGVVVSAIVLLRRELSGMFGRVREIEGPGSLKVVLDESKVEQIIAEGRKENASPSAIAERIAKTATVLDRREARILRALFDDDGRAIFNYQTDYYRSALQSLMAKGHVRKLDRGFALTEEGYAVARKYLLDVMQRMNNQNRQDRTAEPATSSPSA